MPHHATHLDIRNTVASGVEMLGQRTPRSVAAYSSQMFAEATPEVSSSLTSVKKWTSAAGYGIDKVLGMTSEMVLTLYRIAFALARKPYRLRSCEPAH